MGKVLIIAFMLVLLGSRCSGAVAYLSSLLGMVLATGRATPEIDSGRHRRAA